MAVLLREKLIAMVDPLLGNLGYELVDLQLAAGRGAATLRVYIDRGAGVDIDDCERVSREISALLDVHDPIPTAYRLEVSTPGLDRVLSKPAHFARYTGAKVEVELAEPQDGRRRYAGRLEQAGPAGIELTVDGAQLPFSYAQLVRARLVPEWPDTSNKGRRR